MRWGRERGVLRPHARGESGGDGPRAGGRARDRRRNRRRVDGAYRGDGGPPNGSRREGGLRERNEREDLTPDPWRAAVFAAAPDSRGPPGGPGTGPPPEDRPRSREALDVPDPRVPGSRTEKVAAPDRAVALRRALKREDAAQEAVALPRGGGEPRTFPVEDRTRGRCGVHGCCDPGRPACPRGGPQGLGGGSSCRELRAGHGTRAGGRAGRRGSSPRRREREPLLGP